MQRSSAVYEVMTGEAVAWPAAVDERLTDPAERLGVLFDAHHQRLYRLARRLSGQADDARDMVQETFLRAARSPEKVPIGAASEEAWLVRVLINICRDRWRHNAVRARSALQAADVTSIRSPNPESAFVARTTIWRALERLPPRRRAVVILYELEGTGIPAIAKLLGVAPVTVRWHLSRGRRELATVIRQQEARDRLDGQDGLDRQDGLDGLDGLDGQDGQDGND
jgi:RNA polymerase sigma-70 factor, ECF subfamily